MAVAVQRGASLVWQMASRLRRQRDLQCLRCHRSTLRVKYTSPYNTAQRVQFNNVRDQIKSDIGLLRVDKRNSTIDSRNYTRNNVNERGPKSWRGV